MKWRGLYGYIRRLMSEVFPLRQKTQHILRDLSNFYILEVESEIVASKVSTNWAQKYGRLFLAILRPLLLYVYLSLQLNREARFFYMHVIQSIH